MTIHSHASHHFKHSAPFMALVVVIVAVGAFGVFVIDPLVTNDPNAPSLVATLGSGIDEFSAQGGNLLQSALPTDASGWIASIAVFVTLWSVIKVIRELHGPVGGAGDAGSLTSHAIRHTFIAIGVRAPVESWGIVRDSATGHPLPLAKVQLVSTDGVVLDSCVSDRSGRYGFGLSYIAAVARGYRAGLEARKSGYYPSGAPQELPLMSEGHPGIDIVMDRAGDGPVHIHTAGSPGHRLADAAGTLAFWLGVLLVPLAFLRAPDALHGAMFAAFVGAGAVRATWRHPKHQ